MAEYPNYLKPLSNHEPAYSHDHENGQETEPNAIHHSLPKSQEINPPYKEAPSMQKALSTKRILAALGVVGLAGLAYYHTTRQETINTPPPPDFKPHANLTLSESSATSPQAKQEQDPIGNLIRSIQEQVRVAILKQRQENLSKTVNYLDNLKRSRFLTPLNAGKIKKNASKEELPGKTRVEFLVDLVETMYYKGKLPYISSEYEKEVLQDAIVGIVTQESKFDTSARSASDARGPLQIKAGAWSDISGLDFKTYAHDFKTAAHVALRHMNVIYLTIKPELHALKTMLNMSDEDFSKFKMYMMVNAYNAGQGTIKVALQSFAQYLQDKINNKNPMDAQLFFEGEYMENLSAVELFGLFANLTKERQWHKLYKEHASTYVWLTMAGAQATREIVPQAAGIPVHYSLSAQYTLDKLNSLLVSDSSRQNIATAELDSSEPKTN